MHNCDWCTKQYTTRGKLKQHITKHHPTHLQTFVDSVSRCPTCGNIFQTGVQLGGHVLWCGLTDDEYKTMIKKCVHKHFKGHTTETKEKLSLIRSKHLEEIGSGGYTNIKWYTVQNVVGETFVVRGTWELKMARWLNSQNLLWKRKTYLPYVIDGQRRTYTPDFYLPDNDLYIEVKGYFSTVDRKKLSLVVDQNKVKLLLVLEKHIKQLDTGLMSLGDIPQFI